MFCNINTADYSRSGSAHRMTCTTCEKAKKYWEMIQDTLQMILNCVVPLKPELFLLNTMPTIQDIHKKHIIVHIITVARILFGQMRKSIDSHELSVSLPLQAGGAAGEPGKRFFSGIFTLCAPNSCGTPAALLWHTMLYGSQCQ